MTTTRLALLVRVLVALCTRTFFQPDEYFQSLEPAHHAVFGYAHLTWEWLAPKPIRSIFYPALNIPIFWALKTSGLAETPLIGDWLLVYSPRILHGILAAATDIWLCEVTRRWLGSQYVSTALFLSLTSFFHALSLSRSLSNSLETSLTTIALAYYPWDASSKLSPQLIYNSSRIRKALIFAALACMVRPTNAVIWLYLFGRLFWSLRTSRRTATALLFQTVSIGSIAVLSLFVFDSLYYQKPTFTPVNFLLTNLSSVSLFYGFNTWHYYFTQALPILCATALPFVLHGMWLTVSDRHSVALRNMLNTLIWSVGVYSMAGHKEWRFVHPVLPLLHIFAAKSLVDLSAGSSKKSKNSPSKQRAVPSSILQEFKRRLPPIRRRFLILLSLTIPASVYVVFFYCSAPISVLSYIRSLPAAELQSGGIGFLMPCHSTPGHAYLHREYLARGKMWALGCEPPLQNQNLTTYHDQTDVFFQSPLGYLQSRFPSRVNTSFPPSPFPTSVPGAPAPEGYPWAHEWPRYLVFFGALLEQEGVRTLLEAKGYREVWKKGREWEGEGHRKGGVRVWKWSG
ncbi:putative alg9-like mannosyltransferase family protein [Lyophyllum shimeji]|uniref:Mannosyltransferase n=1 Tax=Lyophyllum shimeji TaxID=47721 RepID=A0A9P3UIW3_LYOSH|nr:putative alg9-like mannosyltransferase family protein [Lyophyllum shimeji]